MNQVQASLPATAALLWRESSRWRWTVVAAGVLTLLALMGRVQGTGGGSPPAPPLPIPVPPVPQMATVRLADFHTASVKAEANKAEGERCEERAAALRKLEPTDLPLAQAAQKDDIQKAQACVPLLEASTQRWNAVAQAVAAAEAAPARPAVEQLRAGIGKLDAFDQSRSSAVRQGLPERAAKLAKALDEFDEAVKALARLVALYAASAGGSFDAGRQVQEMLGKLRALPARPLPDALTPAQAETLAAAERIAAEMDAGEQRLQTLAQAWQRREADPQTVANLLAQLNDADRARWDAGTGRPAKIAAMEVAVAAQMPAVLQGLLGSYERERTRAQADRILASQALANRLRAPLPAEARGRLDKVAADVEASKARLARLLAVEQAWNAKAPGARNAALEQDVLAALRAVRDSASAEVNRFDIGSLGEAERRAWSVLHSAQAEIQGTAGPLARLSVSVDTSAIADRFLQAMPRHLATALEAAGFGIARSADTASIRLTLSEPSIKPREGENGIRIYTLSVHARVFWVYRGSEADLGTITGVGSADEAPAAIEAAQVETARHIAEEIGNRLKRGG